MDIAESVVERLCLSLIIPVVRPNSIKVLSHILCSAQSEKLFSKIESRLPNVFTAIIKTNANDLNVSSDFQHLIDLVAAFMNRFPDHRSNELVRFLKKKN